MDRIVVTWASQSAPGGRRRSVAPIARLALAVMAATLWVGAPVAAFSPGDLPGLVLWLDADDGDTIQRGDPPAQVLGWRDKSPAHHLATPADGAAAPMHVPRRGSGPAVVRFDGSSALLLEDSEHLDFQGTDDLTFFAVLAARSNGSILARTDERSMQYRFHVPTERTLRVTFGSGGRQADSVSTIAAESFRLVSVINAEHDGVRRFTIRMDGREEAHGEAGSGRSQARASIGGRSDGRAQRLDGDVAELVLFRRALADAELRQVEQYLLARYALGPPGERQAEAPAGPSPAQSLSDAPEGTFAIAVIPDTQRYHGPGSGRGDQSGEPRNPAFASRIEWIVRNLEKQRIVFVTHVGDVVDRNQHEQWRVARSIMDMLHGRVPYGISVGNHDLGRGGDSSLFQEYFGAERFSGMDWYGGAYAGFSGQAPAVSGNNANSWQVFSAGGLDFVILHLECNAPDDVLAWADGVLAAQRHRLAIVTTHMYLGGVDRAGSREPQGRMAWKKVYGTRGNTPNQMWEKCFRKHPNLLLVLCGDQSSSITHRQESRGDHGNRVHELLQDYPRTADDADWIRLLRFHPAEGVVRAFTYSPAQDRLCDRMGHAVAAADHQFDLDIAEAIDDHLRQRHTRPATPP